MTKPTWPSHPIVDSRGFFVVLLEANIVQISVDQAIYLCSGKKTVSVRKLKSQPRITFVSANPHSAINLTSATIFSHGIGLLLSLGRAATSIASGIAASS